MFTIYKKYTLLVLLLLGLCSCSFFKSDGRPKTKSIDSLLQEDIQITNANSKQLNKSSFADNNFEDEEEDFNLENDSVATVPLKKSANKKTQSKELSLDENLDENLNDSLDENLDDSLDSNNIAAKKQDDDPELSLDDDPELSLDGEELSLDSEQEETENFAQNQQADQDQNRQDFTDLKNISYKQEQGLEILFIASENKVKYKTQFNKQNNQFIVSIKNAKLSNELKKPYFVKKFLGNAIVAVNSYQDPKSNKVDIVLQLKNGTKQAPTITSTSSGLEISYKLASKKTAFSYEDPNPENTFSKTAKQKQKTVKNKSTLSDFFLGRGTYYGHSISLQFENVDIKKVISYIASEVGANILVDDSVQGKVSLKLRNIPWDQALALILKSKSLGYIKESGTLRIASLDKLKKEEENLVSILKSKQSLKPLLVKVIPVSFAKAATLVSKLKVFLTPKRGSATADSRSNTIIATDTSEVLKKIGFLIKNLDQAPSQVSIEAKFIEASQSFSKNLGVNWGFSGGKIDINGLQGSSGPVSIGLGAGGIKPVSSSNLKGLTGSIGLTLGSFKFLGDLSSILAIAEQDQSVKVISTPTVVVLDKQKASITNKSENLSIERTENDGTVTESIKRTPITLQLDVSPQIASDGNILLDVNIVREFAGGAISTGSNAKPINSRAVKSKVLIKNGDTLVIGGIFQKDISTGRSGVPFLSKLPFFGWLFRYQSDEESKNELMVFLTPKIL